MTLSMLAFTGQKIPDEKRRPFFRPVFFCPIFSNELVKKRGRRIIAAPDFLGIRQARTYQEHLSSLGEPLRLRHEYSQTTFKEMLWPNKMTRSLLSEQGTPGKKLRRLKSPGRLWNTPSSAQSCTTPRTQASGAQTWLFCARRAGGSGKTF